MSGLARLNRTFRLPAAALLALAASLAALEAPGAAPPSVAAPPEQWTTEAVLRSLWRSSREADLDVKDGTSAALFEAGLKPALAHEEAREAVESARRMAITVDGKPPAPPAAGPLPPLSRPLLAVVARRPDLQGLAFVPEEECKLDDRAVRALTFVSCGTLGATTRYGRRTTEEDREEALLGFLRNLRGRLLAEAVGALEQVCQAESEAVRAALVGTLAASVDRATTQALARRAVFDPSPEVRKAAIEALRKRPRGDARPVFRAALRHPWPPAADHAALALVALGDRNAVGVLTRMLEAQDPVRPTRGADGRWTVPQLTRINHLRNCLLCHTPAARPDILTRALPDPKKPLPESRGKLHDRLVRADVVLLRADFSVVHHVGSPPWWPAEQRFDYVVRRREIKDPDIVDFLLRRETPYPQREAVRFAIRELTR